MLTLCVGTILALASSAHAQSWLDTPGAPGSATVSAGHATLRLPPGDWLPISESEDVPLQTGGQSLRIQSKYLAQVEGGRLVAVVSIKSNATRSGNGWAPDRQCSRRDILFFENASEANRTYDCMMVNHSMYALGRNPAPSWVDMLRKLSSVGAVAHPLICAVYSMASGSRLDFLNVQVCFNPTLGGFSDEPSTNWDESAWHKLRITPDRQAYVDKVVAWARAYHATVADSF